MPADSDYDRYQHLFTCGCPYGDPNGTAAVRRDKCPPIRVSHVHPRVASAWIGRSSEAFVTAVTDSSETARRQPIFLATVAARARQDEAVIEAVTAAIVSRVCSAPIPPVAPGHVDLAVAEVLDQIHRVASSSRWGATPDRRRLTELSLEAPEMAQEALHSAVAGVLGPGRQATPEVLSEARRELYEAIPAAAAEVVGRRKGRR